MPIFIEAEQALFVHQILNFVSIRKQNFDLDAVMLANPLYKIVGFRMQTACIQSENLQVVGQLVRHFNQHDIFCATERNGDVIVLLQRSFENRTGALAFELFPQGLNIGHGPALPSMDVQGYLTDRKGYH